MQVSRNMMLLASAILCFAGARAVFAVSDTYQQALQARKNGQIQEALSLLHKALQEDPGLAEARFETGLILMELERWSAAEIEFRVFLQLRPDSYEAHNNLAVIYSHLSQEDMLEKELTEVVRLRPRFIRGHTNLADYYSSLALRTLWNAYRIAPMEERGALRSRILRFLAADPSSTEDRFVEEQIARIAPEVSPTALRATPPSAPIKAKGFEIQVYSSKSRPVAEAFRRKLLTEGFTAEVHEVNLEGTTWYRVRLSGFANTLSAQQSAKRLVARGVIREYWIVP